MNLTTPLRCLVVAATAAAGALVAPAAKALDIQRPEIRQFINDLVAKDGVSRRQAEAVLSRVESRKASVTSINSAAERVKQWYEYRTIFITPRRISAGVDFYRENEKLLKKVAADTGVPAEIITAILGVETFYGTRTGGFRVVDALATLAFDSPNRAEFFRSELRALFLLAKEERLDINAIQGSYAGAMGPPQFMPSSYRAYAVDGDKDQRRDLLNNWKDITASIANYFLAHGWVPNQPIVSRAHLSRSVARPDDVNELSVRDTVASLRRQGVEFSTDLPDMAPAMLVYLEGDEGDEYWVGYQNFYAITRYNRSVMYALSVAQLAQAIGEGIAAQDRR
jgi:membrane-bound lytic murein transglycosylase B